MSPQRLTVAAGAYERGADATVDSDLPRVESRSSSAGSAVAGRARWRNVESRRLSVSEIQHALAVVRRIEPAANVAGTELGGGPPRGRYGDDRALVAAAPAETVFVVAAHSGAGASTVAVALADAWARNGDAIQLIETASPARSGLVGAASAELGTDVSGQWRQGMRGPVLINRRLDLAGPYGWPARAGGPDDRFPLLTILDIGPADRRREAPAGAGMTVLVLRATVPGVLAAERCLAGLNLETIAVAVVGRRRSRGAVSASSGPRLNQLRAAGRVVRFPLNRALGIVGITSAPLPKPLMAAATRLLTVLDVPARNGAAGLSITGGVR